MLGAPTHSRFGGLWIDRADWPDALAQRIAQGKISTALGDQIRRFITDGVLILPQAASLDAVDAFQARIAQAFAQGDERVLYQRHGSQVTRPLTEPADPLGCRVVDSFCAFPEALALFATPALRDFLAAIFDAPPLLFQSLSFDQGSQQGLHQDTAYVVVDAPLELAACWIALQDVQPGAGELMYVPGSHRLPDYDFASGGKHWHSERDGAAAHDAWCAWLLDEIARRGLPVQRFLPKKGDMLIWHADLAHGGAAVTNPDLRRQSLVGHFCPATRRPNYFLYRDDRRVVGTYNGLSYASEHYPLTPQTLAADPAAATRNAEHAPAQGTGLRSGLGAMLRRLGSRR